jgi:hypothetical protein
MKKTVLVMVALTLSMVVERVKADFIFNESSKVPNINTPSGDGCGSITSDGLELYISSSYPYGGDECHSDIYVATRSTIKDAWSTPTKLGPPVNTDGPENYPCISPDGLELYFNDGWSPFLVSGCTHRSGGYGGGDLWVSTRTTRDDPWSEPRNLGPNVNSTGDEAGPSISSDGLSLYFQSALGDSFFDIYVTERPTKSDPWGPSENLGFFSNMNSHKTTPSISPDNLSLYVSVGKFTTYPTYTYDIYVSKRESVTADWEAPVRFEPVNSSLSAYGMIFSEGCSTLYFNRSSNWNSTNQSTWPETAATYDIWQVEVTPIVDLNSDGIVDAADMCILVDNWHTENTLCDIGPAPMGDGFVDVQDLIVLAEHLFEQFPPVEPVE